MESGKPDSDVLQVKELLSSVQTVLFFLISEFFANQFSSYAGTDIHVFSGQINST